MKWCFIIVYEKHSSCQRSILVASLCTKKDVLSMTSITGVNLKRLGLHITEPLRVRTSIRGEQEAAMEATTPAGGIMGMDCVVGFRYFPMQNWTIQHGV